MKLLKRNKYLSLVNEFLIDSPVPVNINYMYNLGSLLGLNLVILIITGISQAKHYNPSVDLAFSSSEHIVRDVNNGYLLRYIHANAVSMFFIMVYAHIGKGLYYGSYRAPRRALWIVGVLIFIVKMAKLLAKMYYLNFQIYYNINYKGLENLNSLRNIPQAFIAPRIRANKRIGPHSNKVLSILTGSLLGDGHQQKTSGNSYRFRFEQCEKHKDYLFWLHRRLKNLGLTNQRPLKRKRSTGNIMYYFYTYSFSNFNYIHNEWYLNNKKRQPLNTKEFEELKTPEALAIWIMDDGGVQRYGQTLETHGFREEEVDYLCKFLRERYNLECNKNKSGTLNQFRIRIREESLKTQVNIVKPYIHVSMKYKQRKAS